MSNCAGCPKCGGQMDEGTLMSENAWCYVSAHSPKGFFSTPIIENAKRARACLSCGYLELYIDPQNLAGKIAAAQ